MIHNWKVNIEDNGSSFRIYREDVDGFEMGTLMEFLPENTDLPKSMALEFAQECVKMWNNNSK